VHFRNLLKACGFYQMFVWDKYFALIYA